MWSEEAREAYAQFTALLESKLTQVLEVVKEYISEYHFYILIGATILAIGVILDLVWKRLERKKKNRIDQRIEEQMKEKGKKDNSGVD
jgi:hypothetical protein